MGESFVVFAVASSSGCCGRSSLPIHVSVHRPLENKTKHSLSAPVLIFYEKSLEAVVKCYPRS